MCCEEFGQDTRKEVWVCCMSCKKLAHFACTGFENVKMRFLQTVIFFLGLPSPIAITRRVVGNGDQVCFGFHFFYEHNFCFDKKNSQGCYTVLML
jgi:hypothetical protein